MSEQVSYEQARELAEQSREQDWERPSFGKELFLGNFDLSLIHPQPDTPTEMREKGDAFLERLRVFLEERVDPLQIERDAKIPDDVIQGLKDLGALGMKIPEAYGGLGLSLLYYTKAVALAGTWHSSLGALLSAHQSIGLPEPLRLFGSDEQKAEWLPKLARTHISAFLLTEPDVGSDPARMSCSAVPTEDGNGYVVNGLKLWATNGAIADVVVVMAMVPRSEDQRGGITAFICPCDLEGVRVTHRNEFMGVRGIENSVTQFDNVYLPKENVIGGIGKGLKIALTTLNTGRLSLPASTAAAAKYSLKISREWAAERVQWGKPIGQHDEVAQKLAFVAGTAFGIEAVVDVSCRLADDKRNDIRIEAALAKLYGSEFGWQAVDTMVQIRGGRGFETAESLRRRGEKPVPAEQLQRDMRINRIFEGSTEIMHLLIAREALDTHLGAGGKLLEPGVAAPEKAKAAASAGKFYASWFPKLTVGQGQRPSSYTEFGQLGKHLRFAERNSRKLARSIFYALGVYRAGLERKGALLGRFVDIGAELYAIACACVYAERLGTAEARELADLFCSQSRRRVDTLFHALWANDDDASYRAAQKVLSGRYAWLEADIADPAGDGPMIPRHEAPAVDTEALDEEAPTAAPAG
jgi:alkylation response protein AidB-like acyl-CoA dehydrogenase